MTTPLPGDVLELIVYFAAFGCFVQGSFAGFLRWGGELGYYPKRDAKVGDHEALWQLARSSSSLRRLSLPLLWQTVQISSFKQFARFAQLAAICPQGVAQIRNFFLRFKPVRPYDEQSEDDGGAEIFWADHSDTFTDWVFMDRRAMDPEEYWGREEGGALEDLLRDVIRLDDKELLGVATWGVGPDSDGAPNRGLINALRLLPDAETTQAKFELLVQQMECLERFCVHTRWLPLSQHLCKSLGEKTSLRVLMIGRQGEHEVDNLDHTPLADIFADDGRGSQCRGSYDGKVIFVARLHLLRPGDCGRIDRDRDNLLARDGHSAAFDGAFDGHESEIPWSAYPSIPEAYEDYLDPFDFFVSSDYVRPDMITFSRLSTYLSDPTVEPPFFDLAAFHTIRALDIGASRIKLLVIGHYSRALVRIPQALFLWVKVKLSMLRTTEDEQADTWEGEPYFRAARALRSACRQAASQLAAARSHKLEPEDIERLPEFESALSVYGSWLADASVQEPIARAWNEQVDLGQTDDFDDWDLVDTITRGQSLLQLEPAEEFLRHGTAAADALCVQEALHIGEDCEAWDLEEYDDDEYDDGVPYPIYDDYDEYDDQDGSDSWTDDESAEDDGESGTTAGAGSTHDN